MKIFIGSSTEAILKAKTIEKIIKDEGYEVVLWNELFIPSEYTLESLLNAVKTVDAGVFIFSPDDTISMRGAEIKVARDNVLLETGLFCGTLGRKNICICTTPDVYLPSDFKGLIYANLSKEHYDLRAEILAWLTTVSENANNRTYISNGRYIDFSIDGYIENIKTFPDSIFLVPINNKFDLSDSVPASIHGDFIEFITKNGNNIVDVQSELDYSLGDIPVNSHRQAYPLGTVAISHIKYGYKEAPVLFFANSEKEPKSNNSFLNFENCTPYDFWKSLANSGIKTNRECVLLPLIGTGNAGPCTGRESIISIIDGYFSFYYNALIRSINISIPKHKYDDEKIDLKFIKEYIALKKKAYEL